MAGRGGRKKTQPDGTGGQVPAPPPLLLLPARAAGGPSCSPPILPPAPLREVPASTTVPPRPRPGQAPAPLPRLQTPAGRCQRCRARTRRASSVYPPWSTHCRQASQTPCQSAWPGSSRSWSWRASPAGGAAGSGVRRIGVTGRWEDAVSPITSTTYCTTHSRVILPRLRRPPAIRSGCSGGGHTGGRQRRPSGGAYSQRRGLLLAILAACRRRGSLGARQNHAASMHRSPRQCWLGSWRVWGALPRTTPARGTAQRRRRGCGGPGAASAWPVAGGDQG